LTYQRINKKLSHYGICSRRKAKILIKEKKFPVKEIIPEIGMKVDLHKDIIEINGKSLKEIKFSSRILSINKPKFVITSCSDNHNRKTIFDLLHSKYKKGFFPIGKLDYLIRGTLKISNNRDLCYKLSDPNFKHKRTYIFKITGKLIEKSINLWRSGIELNERKSNPFIIEILEQNDKSAILKIILKEFRNNQIRHIASLLGYKVIDLERVCFDEILLENFKEGNWREIDNYRFEAF